MGTTVSVVAGGDSPGGLVPLGGRRTTYQKERPMVPTPMRLPIEEYEHEVVRSVRKNRVTIIRGQTGSGKSTKVPEWLLRKAFRVVVTEPRRLAARSLAIRVAKNIGVPVGSFVGYRTSMDKAIGPQTRLTFVTDGLQLVRELFGSQSPDVLVIDELHEWHLESETLIAWVKQQLELRPELRVVIMSATIDVDALARYFGGAHIIDVPGRLYPVTEEPAGESIVADVVRHLKLGRDVLCFLPGKREIEQAIRDVRQRGVDAVLLPLHADLEPADQQRVFMRYKCPKAVFATTIAQTSVTIDVRVVIDSGIERTADYDDERVEGLILRTVSLADREQRKGRAGRLGPGIYIDHCPEPENRPAYAVPEMYRISLAQTYLRLKCVDVEMEEMRFFHQPRESDVKAARSELMLLGCLDHSGNLTDIGRRIAKLPVSVRFGRMLVEADRRNVAQEMIGIVAVCEAGGIGERRNTSWRRLCGGEKESDPIAQLNVFNAASRMSPSERLRWGINATAYERACRIRKRLGFEFQGTKRRSAHGTRRDLVISMCTGMVNGGLFRKDGKRYTDGRRRRRLAQDTVLGGGHEWLIAEPRDIETIGGKKRKRKVKIRLLTMATKVDVQLFAEAVPHVVQDRPRRHVRYSPARDLIASRSDKLVGKHVIEGRWVRDPMHPESAQVFAAWLAAATLQGLTSCNPVLNDVLTENRRTIELARELNSRVGGSRFAAPTESELAGLYAARLKGATRAKTIRDPWVLSLPKIPNADREEVLRDCPDTIELGPLVLDVDYLSDGAPSANIRLASPDAAADLARRLPPSAPSLADGRTVMLNALVNGRRVYSGTDIRRLGEALRRAADDAPAGSLRIHDGNGSANGNGTFGGIHSRGLDLQALLGATNGETNGRHVDQRGTRH